MTPTPSNERVEKLCRAAATSIGINVADLLESQRMELFALLTAFADEVRKEREAERRKVCPVCNNDGFWIDVQPNRNTGDAEQVQVQCELCDLRAQLATLQGQTRWECKCGGMDVKGQAENEAMKAQLAAMTSELTRLKEYAFGMESALRGARASGTASELSMAKAEAAEQRLLRQEIDMEFTRLRADRDRYRAQLAAMTARSDAWMTVTGKFDISKQPENKSCLQYVCDEIADLRADRDRYRAACGAMEADKKRLDWLEGAKAADYLEGPCQWQINYNMRLRADTLRAAIDAAMQQHPTSDILTPKTTDKASRMTDKGEAQT